MNKATLNEMLKLAKKNGICTIYYAGMSSGGLYSSRSSSIQLYLTRYPSDFSEKHSTHVDLDKYLDKVTVHNGFIEVNIGTIYVAERGSDNAVESYRYVDEWGSHKVDFLRSSGTYLIPFENIIAITY